MNRHFIVERRADILLALSSVAAIMLAASCEHEVSAARTALAESRAAFVSEGVAWTPDDGRISRDSQVVHVLITANTSEVEQGTLAESRASNESVERFATMMVTDHGAANEQVRSLAQQKLIVPEDNAVSEALQADGSRTTSELAPLVGPAFDTAYMDAQIAGHEKVLEIIDDVLTPAAHDPDLKDLLVSLRKTVASHLEHARRIRGELGANMSGAGSAGGP